MTLHIAIYAFNQVEVLDFAGPFEVFTTAQRVHSKNGAEGNAPFFNVFAVGETTAPIHARAGLKLQPDHSINKHPRIDCLIVPGGVVTAELEKPHVIDWIDRISNDTEITASVCTGAFVLAKTGRLNGLQATTHWEDIADLQSAFPQIQVQSGLRWVDQGHIVTSAGISAGIDMSLHLVERLASRDLALATARQMEFDWTQIAS